MEKNMTKVCSSNDMCVMKERPILFSAPMVRAILKGRKTQTRRVVKSQPPLFAHATRHHQRLMVPNCPYGQPGDLLWVREAWAYHPDYPESTRRAIYRSEPGVEYDVPRWRPSIHMPRWASRILLEIVAVRVERLNDISEADAMAEGVDAFINSDGDEIEQASVMFMRLWEQINGPGSWAANSWVWVVEFKKLGAGGTVTP